MSFDPPAGGVAFEALPPGSIRPAIVAPFIDGDLPEVKAVGPDYSGVASSTTVVIAREPICWVRYLEASGNNQWDPVVFCHRRISSAGHLRLVVVEFPLHAQYDFGDDFLNDLSVQIFAPDSATEIVRPSPFRVVWMGQDPDLPMPSRVYAGRADPADASHFTIEFQWPDGIHGLIDGWLRDDDHVRVKIRPGTGDVESERRRLKYPPNPFGSPPADLVPGP
ncbi:MAG TPA: hypothetical protein VHY37_09860 [Tepidisphaeraceae bacterium]|jgi:hypothetical protein|nr:hypothetical protein [Tepidisphaeraceae bacterium]